MQSILVFDLGGSSIKYGVWRGDNVTQTNSIATPDSWKKMKEELKKIQNQLGKENDFLGVAISSPGAVDIDEGIIKGNSAIWYIHHFPIKQELSELFKLPVSLQNDANCAALAEVWKGAAKDVETSAYMIIGSGIGGAYVSGGKLITGRHLFGGEFGWMLLNDNLTLSEGGSPVKMAERFSEERADRKYTGKEVFELFDQGDDMAVKHIDTMLDSLARGVYNLCICFDADRYLIGGGISKRPDVIDKIVNLTNFYLKRQAADDIKPSIQACKFFNDSNLIGAVYQFLLENPNLKNLL